MASIYDVLLGIPAFRANCSADRFFRLSLLLAIISTSYGIGTSDNKICYFGSTVCQTTCGSCIPMSYDSCNACGNGRGGSGGSSSASCARCTCACQAAPPPPPPPPPPTFSPTTCQSYRSCNPGQYLTAGCFSCAYCRPGTASQGTNNNYLGCPTCPSGKLTTDGISCDYPKPTSWPTFFPIALPTLNPSFKPSAAPTLRPTPRPTTVPTPRPTNPTGAPSGQPTRQPFSRPTSHPTRQPTRQPSQQPSAQPSIQPNGHPTGQPSGQPTRQPTTQPTSPTGQPSRQPTRQPTARPSSQPLSRPTGQPSKQPLSRPSGQPTRQPTQQPTRQPTSQPTRRPSTQPSRQPSRQPVGGPTSQPSTQPSRRPSHQPSIQPTSLPTSQPTLAVCAPGHFILGEIRAGRESFGAAQGSCQACPAGKISTVPDAHNCTECAAGRFAPTTGLTVCQPAPPGSFSAYPGSTTASFCPSGQFSRGSESIGCLPCLPGTYGGVGGAVACAPCPKNFYSDQLGVSACAECPFGRLTPIEGATSETDCLTPAPNFAWGSTAFLVVSVLGFVYVMRGRFHLASLNRRKDVVGVLKTLFSAFRNDVETEDEQLHVEARVEQLRLFVSAIVKPGVLAVPMHAFYVLWDVASTLIFAALSIVGVAVGTVFLFVASVSSIYFASLIYWKQSSALLGLVHFRGMIDLATENTLMVFAGLNLPSQLLDLARFALDIVRQLFVLLSLFKIDLSGLNVTCEGSKAPLILLINLSVFGAVVVVVQSQVQLFRSLVLAPTLDSYTSLLLSSEYRSSYFGRPFKKGKCKSCLVWLWQSALPMPVRRVFHPFYQRLKYVFALIQIIPVLAFSKIFDVKVFLRFAIAQVQFTPLVRNRGIATDTAFCNKVPGLLNFDAALAYCSTFAVYLLLIPVLYEAARVVCPNACYADRKQIEEDKRTSKARSLRRHSEKVPSPAPHDSVGLFKYFTYTVRYVLTYLAPDMYLAFFTKRLFHALKRSIELQLPASSPAIPNEPSMKYQDHESHSFSASNPMHLRGTQPKRLSAPVPGFNEEAFFLRVSTVERNEEELDDGLPYWELLCDEALELITRGKQNFPAIFTAPLPVDKESSVKWRQSLTPLLTTIFLAIFPVGHLFTSCGNRAMKDAAHRFLVFFLASFGIWAEGSARGFLGKDNVVKEFAGDDAVRKEGMEQDENRLNSCYAAALDAILSPRAILLQLCPFVGGIWSQFTINTASSAIFAQPNSGLVVWDSAAKQCMFPLIVFADAVSRAQNEQKGRYRHKNWFTYLSAFRAVFQNSRSFQFVLQLYKTILPILLLRNPSDLRVVASMVCILLPTAFVNALGIVLTLGIVMNIKDIPFLGNSTYGATCDFMEEHRQEIKKMVKAHKAESEIFESFKNTADPTGLCQRRYIARARSVFAPSIRHVPRGSQGHRHSASEPPRRDTIPGMDASLAVDIHESVYATPSHVFPVARLKLMPPPTPIYAPTPFPAGLPLRPPPHLRMPMPPPGSMRPASRLVLTQGGRLSDATVSIEPSRPTFSYAQGRGLQAQVLHQHQGHPRSQPRNANSIHG